MPASGARQNSLLSRFNVCAITIHTVILYCMTFFYPPADRKSLLACLRLKFCGFILFVYLCQPTHSTCSRHANRSFPMHILYGFIINNLLNDQGEQKTRAFKLLRPVFPIVEVFHSCLTYPCNFYSNIIFARCCFGSNHLKIEVFKSVFIVWKIFA